MLCVKVTTIYFFIRAALCSQDCSEIFSLSSPNRPFSQWDCPCSTIPRHSLWGNIPTAFSCFFVSLCQEWRQFNINSFLLHIYEVQIFLTKKNKVETTPGCNYLEFIFSFFEPFSLSLRGKCVEGRIARLCVCLVGTIKLLWGVFDYTTHQCLSASPASHICLSGLAHISVGPLAPYLLVEASLLHWNSAKMGAYAGKGKG